MVVGAGAGSAKQCVNIHEESRTQVAKIYVSVPVHGSSRGERAVGDWGLAIGRVGSRNTGGRNAHIGEHNCFCRFLPMCNNSIVVVDGIAPHFELFGLVCAPLLAAKSA